LKYRFSKGGSLSADESYTIREKGYMFLMFFLLTVWSAALLMILSNERKKIISIRLEIS